MKFKVKVVYRDYIPLYSGYSSFWELEDPSISFEVSPPRSHLKRLYKIYRGIKNIPGMSKIIPAIQKRIFPSPKTSQDLYDGYFFAGILPDAEINKPFVIDYEHAHCLFDYSEVTDSKKQQILKILDSPHCLATLPWSKRAEESMQKIFPEHWDSLKNKSHVLYPALKSRPISRKFTSRTPQLLFIGKEAVRKGLLELLEAMNILKSQHGLDFHLTCISDFQPDKWDIPRNLNVRFLKANFTQKQLLEEFYAKNDLFVMPTREDTFGMVLLEALSTGMPVITTQQFAASEIVRENFNGFLVHGNNFYLDRWLYMPKEHNSDGIKELDSKIVEGLVSKLLFVSKNPSALNDLSQNCLSDFSQDGKFSQAQRNKILKRIFLGQG
jgi:glycosyltransferase involved in cell wall biosynthesis